MGHNHLTVQQEAFARDFVRLGVEAHAYRLNYNIGKTTKITTVYRQAHEVRWNPKVAARIVELEKAARDLGNQDAHRLVGELDQIRFAALSDGKFAAAATATMGKARVMGIVHSTRGNPFAPPEPLREETPEERSRNDLARRVAYLLHKGMLLLPAKEIEGQAT